MVTSGQGTQQRTTPPVEETEHSNPEEDLSAIIGKTGPFQWTMLLYTAYGTTVFAMHAVIYAIITPRGVSHWCQLPAPPANTTATAWKELNIPRTTQDSFSGCLVYAEPVRQAPPWNDNGTLETIPCAARNFNESYGRLTIIEEWDLVCDREWLYDFLSGAFLLGSFFGLAISGLLADRVGRRPVVCVCVVLLEAVGLSVPSANSFALFATLRFFEGAFVSATSYTAYVLLVEVVELSKRALYGTFSLCGFNIGILIASVLVHMANDWRMVQLATMITSTGLLVGFGLLLESPRWLITTLRVREALRVVTLILRKNRVPAAVIEKVRRKLKVEPLQMLYQKDEESHGRPTEPPSLRQRREPAKELERLDKSVWDLLVIFTTQYKFSNLTMWLCWFSCSLTYYIIAFDVGAASIGNQSQFLFSATTPFAAYFLISRWGRRNVLVTSLAITSMSCAIVAVLPRDTTFVVVLVAWFLVNVSNNVTFLYANEIYATIVRALGFNVGAAVGRVGVIVAQIFYQDFAKHTFQWRSACYAVLSVCCGASGLMIIMLPNSKECYLPEKVKAEDDIFYFSPMRYSGGKRKIDHLWGSPVGGASGTGLSGRLRLTSLFERIPMIIRGNSYAFVPDPQATVFETQRGLPTGSETTVVQQGSMARKVDSRGNQQTGRHIADHAHEGQQLGEIPEVGHHGAAKPQSGCSTKAVPDAPQLPGQEPGQPSEERGSTASVGPASLAPLLTVKPRPGSVQTSDAPQPRGDAPHLGQATTPPRSLTPAPPKDSQALSSSECALLESTSAVCSAATTEALVHSSPQKQQQPYQPLAAHLDIPSSREALSAAQSPTQSTRTLDTSVKRKKKRRRAKK